MNEFDFIIDGMTWSFSRLNSFYSSCPKSWKEIYIDCKPKCSNAFGEFGSTVHKCLERYFKGEIEEWDLVEEYKNEYNNTVKTSFPPNAYANLEEKYYKQGLNYFENFSFDKDKYDILGIEKKVEFEIDGKPFVGFIDLLLRIKETGEIIIWDHKSASIKFNKNGSVSKKDADHFKSFQRQLYLYALPIIKEYGRVDYLEWNMFRDGALVKIPFNQKDFEETYQWASDTIKAIENTTEFLPKFDYYYCANLCDVRTECPYRRLGMIYQGIHTKCYSEKSQYYPDFGGMGIKMCDEWKEDMNEFFKWALENGYNENMVLKRYDEADDFDIFNCYWDIREPNEEFLE